MIIKPEKIHEDFSRDTYWTRIHLESDDHLNKSVVLTCASHEYLWDKLGVRDLGETDLQNWLNSVIEKWQAKGGVVFSEPTHQDVYANTEEGIKNGLIFLETITP